MIWMLRVQVTDKELDLALAEISKFADTDKLNMTYLGSDVAIYIKMGTVIKCLELVRILRISLDRNVSNSIFEDKHMERKLGKEGEKNER